MFLQTLTTLQIFTVLIFFYQKLQLFPNGGIIQVWCMTRPYTHTPHHPFRANKPVSALARAQDSPKCTYIVAQQHSWSAGAALPWSLSV